MMNGANFAIAPPASCTEVLNCFISLLFFLSVMNYNANVTSVY